MRQLLWRQALVATRRRTRNARQSSTNTTSPEKRRLSTQNSSNNRSYLSRNKPLQQVSSSNSSLHTSQQNQNLLLESNLIRLLSKNLLKMIIRSKLRNSLQLTQIISRRYRRSSRPKEERIIRTWGWCKSKVRGTLPLKSFLCSPKQSAIWCRTISLNRNKKQGWTLWVSETNQWRHVMDQVHLKSHSMSSINHSS